VWERQLAKLAVSASEDDPSDRSYDPELEEDYDNEGNNAAGDEEDYNNEWTGCNDAAGEPNNEEWMGFTF
jgi:hypothetical protein